MPVSREGEGVPPTVVGGGEGELLPRPPHEEEAAGVARAATQAAPRAPAGAVARRDGAAAGTPQAPPEGVAALGPGPVAGRRKPAVP